MLVKIRMINAANKFFFILTVSIHYYIEKSELFLKDKLNSLRNREKIVLPALNMCPKC